MKKGNKRFFALLLAALLTLTAFSCAKEEPPSGNPGNNTPAKTDVPSNPDAPAEKPGGTEPGGSTPGDASEEPSEPAETLPPEQDYSWFEFPADTGRLTVYTDAAMGRAVMNPAVRIFQEKYPGVEVDYKTMGDDEFQALIRTEIPAGKGPDLLLFASPDIPDVYKTAAAGLFTDLNLYFAKDGEIDLSDFITPVMDGALLNGQRFFAPLSVPLFRPQRFYRIALRGAL